MLLRTGPRSQTTARTISQTTAKVVLIGDTGVGRSAMAEAAKTGKQKITAAWVVKGKTERGRYDVFLSHNSKDKAVVEDVGLDGRPLWTAALPSPPVRWGVALTGKQFAVTLSDGHVVCFGDR